MTEAFELYEGDALDAYPRWPTPTSIVSDGAYGLRLFPGDPPTEEGLVEWYNQHVSMWAKCADPSTTLWFWNSELGWATVHPLLLRNGWEYQTAHVWDKGLAHIAGNVNGRTIRRFPVVTEICVLYSRVLQLPAEDGLMPVKQWLRHEWKRAGLPLSLTNEACGVKNAATRKYFTQCHLWYFPPPEMMERLANYANTKGQKTDRPYFSLDGVSRLDPDEWNRLRYKWNHSHGITNVWRTRPLHGEERVKEKSAALHANQKPLDLMRQIVEACTERGDVVWEPFGGLCSASVAAVELGRVACAAERQPEFASVAAQRLKEAVNRANGLGQGSLSVS